MKTNQVVQTTALSKVNGQSSLREGSSVYVRVIKNNGNNSYIVAFSGGRFAIKSDVALKEGAGFLAKIKLADGKILLQKMESKPVLDNSIQKLSSEGQKTFLQNLGLVPDNISMSIFQQMKELGMKFDLSSFNKARRIGLQFKGKEKQAAEIAYILESKGIDYDSDYVKVLLDEDSDFRDEIDYSNVLQVVEEQSSFKDFFMNVFNRPDMFSNAPGLLTIFNHLGFNFQASRCAGNWVKVPFEFENSDIAGKGVFCAFIKNQQKKLDKASILFKLGEKNYFFGVCFGVDGICSLQAGCSDENKRGPLIDALRSSFEKNSVEYIEPEEFSSFFTEDSDIEVFRGLV